MKSRILLSGIVVSFLNLKSFSFIKTSIDKVSSIQAFKTAFSSLKTLKMSHSNPQQTETNHFPLIDCGVNYGSKHYNVESITKILNTAHQEKNITHILSISNSLPETRTNIYHREQLSSLTPVEYYYTAGIHPHNAKSFQKEQDLHFLEDIIHRDPSRCVAIGECGLDYNRMFSTKEQQIEAFECQILLAKKYHKQLYLHCRDAFDDFIELLRKHEYYHGIVHCFTGDIDQAIAFTSLGFKLGITGWLLDKRRNHDLLHAIQDPRITIEMLVVETDSPFLSIKRSRKSIPQDTSVIVEKIAELKNIPLEICSEVIYRNSLNLLMIHP